MARAEFGRPKDIQSALSRLPEYYEKPPIEVDPYERVAMLRIFMEDLLQSSKVKKLETLPLHMRTIPVELEAIKLLHNLNSFQRNMETSKTYHWSFVGTDAYPWPVVYVTGEDAYIWLQITELSPLTEVGTCKLVCIEINNRLEESSQTRFNYNSDFDFALVTKGEIETLHLSLSKHCVAPQNK